MISKLVRATLKPLGLPVALQHYDGNANQYITYFEYLQRGEGFEDNEESQVGHYYQVDVWSKTNYNTLVTNTKKVMKDAGFVRKMESELYEKETKTFHKVLRYFYLEEN